MKHYRCVVLVIAHHDPAYERFKEIWVKHWEAHKGVLKDMQCFYIYNDETKPHRVEGRDLYFPYKESYPAPGLLIKTFAAVDYMDANGITYDMLYRTNLSSLINWPAFSKYVDGNLGKSMYYAGRIYKPKHISGAGMLLSKDLVHILRENLDTIDFDMPDDHAINLWFHANIPELEFHPIKSVRWINKSEAKRELDMGTIHFRFHKGWGLDNDRENDQDRMEELYEMMGGSNKHRFNIFYVLLIALLIFLFVKLFKAFKRKR